MKILPDTERDVGLRRLMVDQQCRQRGIRDQRVLDAMQAIPRHQFVPLEYQREAYADHPVSIGSGQTISQPYIVAYMTEQLDVQPSHDVLEIGMGCGYQTAILARLAQHVYAIEYLPELAQIGQQNLDNLNITNVDVVVADGTKGWPQPRTFDRILAAAAPLEVPQPLVDQLGHLGKLVMPVGPPGRQRLVLLTKTDHEVREQTLCYCRFVPLVED